MGSEHSRARLAQGRGHGALSVQGGGGAVRTREGWGYAGAGPGSHETLESSPAYQLTAEGFLPGVSTVHEGVWTRRAVV